MRGPPGRSLFGSPQEIITELQALQAVGVRSVLISGGEARESMRRFAADRHVRRASARYVSRVPGPNTTDVLRLEAKGSPGWWELRHNFSGYDATYVALTETLSATALLTTDARLVAAPGVR